MKIQTRHEIGNPMINHNRTANCIKPVIINNAIQLNKASIWRLWYSALVFTRYPGLNMKAVIFSTGIYTISRPQYQGCDIQHWYLHDIQASISRLWYSALVQIWYPDLNIKAMISRPQYQGCDIQHWYKYDIQTSISRPWYPGLNIKAVITSTGRNMISRSKHLQVVLVSVSRPWYSALAFTSCPGLSIKAMIFSTGI